MNSFLLIAAVSIAFIHSLAPDHYVPVSAVGRSRKWSLSRTLTFSFIAASMHVASSAALGLSAFLGMNMLGLAVLIESHSPHILIAFGLFYALLSHLKPHRHTHAASLTTLLLILGVSPCIPLVPLTLSAKSVPEALMVVITFSATTILTILALTYITYRAYRPPGIAEKEDVVSGLIIALAGLVTWILETARRKVCLQAKVAPHSQLPFS